MHQLGLGDYWESENLPEQGEWEGLIRERIHLREEEDWKHEMKERSKLRTYITLKHKLERETYLELRDRYGAPELTKIRGGSNRLRIESRRYQKIPRELRLCEVCTTGQVEDESHFMLECPLYDDFRKELWGRFESMLKINRNEISKEEQLNILIGHGNKEW